MPVDNTSFVPYNEKRYSSKLYSKSMYDVGTVWVMDATHTPYGCSVWPALFTREPPCAGSFAAIANMQMVKTGLLEVKSIFSKVSI